MTESSKDLINRNKNLEWAIFNCLIDSIILRCEDSVEITLDLLKVQHYLDAQNYLTRELMSDNDELKMELLRLTKENLELKQEVKKIEEYKNF